MEITLVLCKALLTAPAGKRGVQEGVHPVHGGLERNGFAAAHLQLHHNVAAGDQVQLLPLNVAVTVGVAFLTQGGDKKAVLSVKNAEAQVIHREGNPQQQDDEAAPEQDLVFPGAGDHGGNADGA